MGRVLTVFGLNFQAVSVGQKLLEDSVRGGYVDSLATPTSQLLHEIKFVDLSIGRFVRNLKDKGIFGETLIIITAKHGNRQSITTVCSHSGRRCHEKVTGHTNRRHAGQ